MTPAMTPAMSPAPGRQPPRTPRAARAAAALVALVLPSGLLAGCASDPRSGYSFSDAHRTDVRTVAVPVFDNSTFYHGLEFSLTDAIIKEIHRSTPWRVAALDAADTTLRGSIDDVDLRRLSRGSETGIVQEQAVDMEVSFEWKQNRTGQVLVARRKFRAAESFVPAQGAQERLELGEEATIDQLAKDLVAELRGSW